MGIAVLIVEDESECLRRFVDVVLADPALTLVGAVSSGQAAITMADASPPDVVLVDLGLPDVDGIEVIRHVVRHHPQAEVLVVTMFGDDAHIVAAVEAGATGYLLKDAAPRQIVEAIHAIRAGDAPITPSIARRVLSRFRALHAPAPATAPTTAPTAEAVASPLTERETEILQLVGKGLSFADVAQLLEVSPHTVVTHVKRIYRKLAVHSRGEAVFEARSMGLL
ncbi:MAG: response regulator transcription factor [Rubrivivax sp.]|nr:response regulator transcription factor [Rubrivivax sp.]